MLYVQFDSVAQAAPSMTRRPPAGTVALARVRRLEDIFDGLELRAAEPAVLLFRYAVAFAFGVDGLQADTWRARGLDLDRGLTIVLGERSDDGRFPLGVAAFARPSLRNWLRDVRSLVDDDLMLIGDPSLIEIARPSARAPWIGTLASDDPYLELRVRFSLGGLWLAACRREARFQVEMVASLPGLSPLHVIARDPPEGVDEIISPDRPVKLRRDAGLPTGAPLPPTWDEPGPCDCGVPPDACAMKRFRLVPSDGAPASPLPGADTFRQLSASLVDLHAVSDSRVEGILPGDRVLVARSPDSLAVLDSAAVILDGSGTVRARGRDREGIVGAVLGILPWPPLGRPFRQTFSGIW